MQLTWEHFLVRSLLEELGGRAKTEEIHKKVEDYSHGLSRQQVEHFLLEMEMAGLVEKTPEGEWMLNE